LSQSREQYDALAALLDTLTPDQMTDPGTVGDWSVKDVLAHLTAWSRMFLGWYEAGKRGEQPVTPAEGYNWQQIPALNQRIYEQHRDRPLADTLADFRAAHAAAMSAIESMSDEEMFTPKVYAWTKTTTLGSYAVSATCSHYDWARKEIRKGIKAKA
jgi:uncharacterized protein (TIGR03083 family)